MGKSKTRGNGEGSIYYSKSKKYWVGQYTIGINNEGKPRRKTIYGKTRKEVKEKIEQLVTEIKTNKYVEKSNIVFKDIAKEIVCPVLAINGREDITVPEIMTAEHRQAIKGIIQKYYDDCGHSVPNDQPDLLAKDILEFIR